MAITPERVRRIHDEKTLFEFLGQELGWPVTTEPDTYPFDAEELGLTDQAAGRIGEVRQIASFTPEQPWGIFLVTFQGHRVDRVALRRVLRGLSETRRDRDASLPAWKATNLLFICTPNFLDFTFARFDGRTHTRATLSLFGWDSHGGGLRTLCDYNLPALHYPTPDMSNDVWLRRWAEAFDVEAVTGRFYNDFKAVFDRAEGRITGLAPAGGATAEEAKRRTEDKRRLFTLRLFNRLMFIHFLSKKGWMEAPDGSRDYLRSLWNGRDAGSNFYTSRLCPLFFAALNKQHVWRETLSAQVGRVPFLNGGLFAQLDADPQDDMVCADSAGEEVMDDIFADVLGEAGLFHRYNFTVMESTPSDVEVAVDPEMLGKVFEELVTGRHDTGSYYTPRPIVAFMCRESLKGYLTGDGVDAAAVATLVDGDRRRGADALSGAQMQTLLAKLRAVTVCDPACGSGAYLLGMLQELFDLIEALERRIEPASADDRYRRKLDIVQRNLYGADRDPFAVQISMLRLWLSLVVDDKRDPLADQTADVALPNLDFKVEQGDSLVAPNADAARLTLDVEAYRRDAAQLARLYAEFFTPSGRTGTRQKRAVMDDIRAKRAEIAHLLGTDERRNVVDWRVAFAQVFAPRRPASGFGGGLPLDGDGSLPEPDLPGGFDIVIANPPYGAKVEDEVRYNFFDKRSADEKGQSKDTYGLFMARALQLLRPAEGRRPGGQFSFIVSDTWRTIKSHQPLRKRLASETTVAHVLDLPGWVFKTPTVNTCILTLSRGRPAANHKLIAGDLRPIPAGDWPTLEANLRAVASHGPDVQTLAFARYTYPQSLIGTYDNYSFFIGSPSLYKLMSDSRFIKLGSKADVKVGLQTGDNEYYLCKRPSARGSYELLDEKKLLTETEILGLSQQEMRKGVDPAKYDGRCFVPYDKGGGSDAEGGWLPNYHVPTGYFINWSQSSVHRLDTHVEDARTLRGKAVMRNREWYFKKGITFSDTGFYAPTFRFGSASVIDVMGMTIFSDSLPIEPLIAIMTSRLVRNVIKNNINHSVHTQVEGLKPIPLPDMSDQRLDELKTLVRQIVQQQETDPRYPYHMHEQKEIDALVYDLYGLSSEDIREVELWFCRRYERLAKAQGAYADAQTHHADYLAWGEQVMAKPPGYWQSHPILKLIALGEGQTLDFKRTLAVDVQTGRPVTNGGQGAIKDIAGFLNADGGTLLFGVSDAGVITGIAPDLLHVNHRSNGGFEEKLRQMIETNLEPVPYNLVAFSFETLSEGVVCRVDVTARPDVVTYFNRSEVYVRVGNRCSKLEARALVEWMQNRRSL